MYLLATWKVFTPSSSTDSSSSRARPAHAAQLIALVQSQAQESIVAEGLFQGLYTALPCCMQLGLQMQACLPHAALPDAMTTHARCLRTFKVTAAFLAKLL